MVQIVLKTKPLPKTPEEWEAWSEELHEYLMRKMANAEEFERVSRESIENDETRIIGKSAADIMDEAGVPNALEGRTLNLRTK